MAARLAFPLFGVFGVLGLLDAGGIVRGRSRLRLGMVLSFSLEAS